MPLIDAFFLRMPVFSTLSDKSTRLLYIVRLIRDLTNKITLFFMPIFLFVIGKESDVFSTFAVSSLQAGMLTIAVFYLISRTAMLFTAIPSSFIISKLGFNHAITVSYILRIAVFSALYFSSSYTWLIFVAAAFEGVQANFFWNSFFTALSNTISKRTAGVELGILQFFVQLLSVLTPAFSGYLAVQYGYEVIFLLGIVLSLLSAVFTINLDLKLPKDEVSWKEFQEWLHERAFQRLAGSMVGRYINDSLLFLWPLYVFLLLGSAARVGFLYTFSLLLSMILTIFIGSYLDKRHGKRPYTVSGSMLTVLWFLRTQIVSVWSIAFVDMFERLFANVHWLFYDWMFIRRGKGGQAFSYFVYREMIVSFSALIFWMIFGGFFLFTSSWNALFIFGGVGVLLSLLISDRHHEKNNGVV